MFVEIQKEDLMEIDGGFIITGGMIALGIGCLAGGAAFGYYLGKCIWR